VANPETDVHEQEHCLQQLKASPEITNQFQHDRHNIYFAGSESIENDLRRSLYVSLLSQYGPVHCADQFQKSTFQAARGSCPETIQRKSVLDHNLRQSKFQ
jgi:hypothetical protein